MSLWRVQVLSNGSLFVNEVFVEDAGKYGCMAGNNGGLEREEAYLHVYSGNSFTSAYRPSDRRTETCTLAT